MTVVALEDRPNPVRAFLNLVMIEHSVFALPFAYLAALTAMLPDLRWGRLALITVAMVAGRTVAMAANRIIDRHIDAQNPRTAKRELITGVVSLRTAWLGLALSLVVFLVSAAALNWLSLALAPLAVAALVVYSYAKRFTNYPQAFLALAQAIAPIGAWIGVTGRWSWPAVLLGVAVGTWIGGFDCIYACQDYEADKRIGIGSVPVRWGIAGSLRISSAVHVVTMAFFVWFGLVTGYGWLWWVGLAATAVVLVYEHAIVKADDLSRVNRAFFTANGVIGIAVFLFALADLVLLQGLRG
ncbi:MAG TPA: menaquinone biosynthesis prenyltransferase MqnP [Rugosimonospora sp.]|nr:menaquinone biosynthesis prenyltransferase MqnP [Rugosimonospora sp.]